MDSTNQQPPTWGNFNPQHQDQQPLTWGNHQPNESDDPSTTPQLNESSWKTNDNVWGDSNSENPPLTNHPQEETVQEDPSVRNLDVVNLEKVYTSLGSVSRLEIKNELYQFNLDLSKPIHELKSTREIKDLGDGRYGIDFQPNTELGNIVSNIKSIGEKQGLKLVDCFIYKVGKGESSINIFKGKTTKSFIFFLQADYTSGKVIMDLSSMGGPSVSLMDSSPNILSLFPGWIPFSISKNNSPQELVAIAGHFI